jgi:hypothetical protein
MRPCSNDSWPQRGWLTSPNGRGRPLAQPHGSVLSRKPSPVDRQSGQGRSRLAQGRQAVHRLPSPARPQSRPTGPGHGKRDGADLYFIFYAVLPSGRTSACAACRIHCGSRWCVLTDECFLRAHNTELITFGVGEDSPGLGAGLSDVYPARPERKKTVNLLIAIGGVAGEVNMHAILDRLGVVDRHEAHADGRVLVGSDNDLILALAQYLPAKRLRPEPGQARQIMSINDDVVQSYWHVASMRRALDPHPTNPGFSPALPDILICRIAVVAAAVKPTVGAREGGQRELDQDHPDAVGILDPHLGQSQDSVSGFAGDR